MSSPRPCTRKPRRQLRACVLEKCSNADLVNQYKSFAKHIKRERNARAEGKIDEKRLQEKLHQLRAEKDECTRKIEEVVRQNTAKGPARVKRSSAKRARDTPSGPDSLEQAAKCSRRTLHAGG